LTGTPASSSSACPAGIAPSLQVLPSAIGHTLNLGAPRYSADATESVTLTERLDVLELQTQITNVAVCPALTSEELEKDWTCTHSWATVGFFLGFAEDVGVGVGFGFGVLLGDGLGEDFFVDELGVGVGFFVDVLSVGVGSDDLDGDALDDAEGEAELLAEALGLALELADLLGRALELADLVGAGDLAGTIKAVSDAARVEFFGTDPQAALTIGPAAELVARASPDMVAIKKANPLRAPITTGFASCGLKPRTSLQCFFWPERAFALTLCTANLKVTSNPK
jgi:hypothetical protein